MFDSRKEMTMPRIRTHLAIAALALAPLSLLALPAHAADAVRVGQVAPEFSGTDSKGETVRLADLKA